MNTIARIGSSLFVLVFLFLLVAPTPVRGDDRVETIRVVSTQWGESPQSAKPGDYGLPLLVTLRNEINETLYGITATLGLSRPLLNLTGGVASWAFYSTQVSAMQQFTVSFRLQILSNASLGVYSLPLNVSYYAGSKYEFGQVNNLAVSVPVLGNPILYVSANRTDIIGGLNNDVALTVNNTGMASMHNLQLSVSTQSPLVAVAQNLNWLSNELSANQSITLPLTLFAPQSQTVQTASLTLTAKYRDPIGVDKTETRTVSFSVRGLIQLRFVGLVTTPSEAQVGKALTLSGQLINSGSVTAKEVILRVLDSPPFTSAEANTVSLTDVAPGVLMPFSIRASVGQPATINQTYPLTIQVLYKNDRNVQEQSSTSLNVYVTNPLPSATGGQQGQRSSDLMGSSGLLLAAFGAVALVGGFFLGRLTKRRPIEEV